MKGKKLIKGRDEKMNIYCAIGKIIVIKPCSHKQSKISKSIGMEECIIPHTLIWAESFTDAERKLKELLGSGDDRIPPFVFAGGINHYFEGQLIDLSEFLKTADKRYKNPVFEIPHVVTMASPFARRVQFN